MAGRSWRGVVALVVSGAIAVMVMAHSTTGWRKATSGIVASHTDDALLAPRLRSHVYRLAHEIGDRQMQRYDALQQAERYVAEQLARLGYPLDRQTYAVDGLAATNLIATKPGTTAAEEIVILGAHYDSCFNPGADDNASGVAGLLEIARLLVERPTARTIRFIAFVNEEPPYYQTESMGSRVYARQVAARGDRLQAVAVLESIGYYTDAPRSQQYPPPFGLFYPDRGNFIGVVGNLRSRRLVATIAQSFRRHSAFPLESIATFEWVTGVGWSDHWSFWQESVPAVMITDTAFLRNPQYHLPSDTWDTLDYARMAQVVRGFAAVLTELATVQ